MHVRTADGADLASLVRLRATWRAEPATPEFTDAFVTWFRGEGAERWWWVAEGDGAVVGMVNLRIVTQMPAPGAPVRRWGYLGNLFVLPAHRGGGVGGQLVRAVIDRARDERLVRVVLNPSEASVPLYRRHGFVPGAGLLVRTLTES